MAFRFYLKKEIYRVVNLHFYSRRFILFSSVDTIIYLNWILIKSNPTKRCARAVWKQRVNKTREKQKSVEWMRRCDDEDCNITNDLELRNDAWKFTWINWTNERTTRNLCENHVCYKLQISWAVAMTTDRTKSSIKTMKFIVFCAICTRDHRDSSSAVIWTEVRYVKIASNIQIKMRGVEITGIHRWRDRYRSIDDRWME